ncbi:MAG: DUF3761 domain-containing protein [Gemmatimonadota bacterium]|nr:DUF3761 domain-containing protein [Gemmatimonadota bacterium]
MKIERLFAGALLAVALTLPAAARAQAAMTTVCKDGSSSAVAGRGACSSHGGVDKKATKAAVKAARDQEKAARKAAHEQRSDAGKVTCTDGSMSKAGRGACSRHGGIAGSGATAPVTPAPEHTRAPAASGAPTSSATGGSGAGEDNNSEGAVAKCKDGLYSHSRHRRGACSRHGGVAQWLKS